MAKGHKTGGRKRGTQNKLTGDLKEMILGALGDAGGRKYLATQATESPAAFLSLVGKVLPMQLTGKDGGPVAVTDTSPVESARRIAFVLGKALRAQETA